MSANTLGHIIRFSSFGESHGSAIGGILEGLPVGLELDYAFIQTQLARRRPEKASGGTPRKEEDAITWLSGIKHHKTTGAPLAFLVENRRQQPADYQALKNLYRPSHSDYTHEKRFGMADLPGGGRSSARETVSRVVAGAIVHGILKKHNISISAAVTQLGPVKADVSPGDIHQETAQNNIYGFADPEKTTEIARVLKALRAEKDSTGGVITTIIRNVPPGLGAPIYHKLHADLGAAMLSINSVKGFDLGAGFDAPQMKGSEHNDPFRKSADGTIRHGENRSGGIQGGISNGEDIYFRVAFKPVSSIGKPQYMLTRQGQIEEHTIKGRHDTCVVPRAIPIVEAMTALVMADHLAWKKSLEII